MNVGCVVGARDATCSGEATMPELGESCRQRAMYLGEVNERAGNVNRGSAILPLLLNRDVILQMYRINEDSGVWRVNLYNDP